MQIGYIIFTKMDNVHAMIIFETENFELLFVSFRVFYLHHSMIFLPKKIITTRR